jgi:Protein of unknown function (DUF3489)
MTRLSDPQLVILSGASQRDDGAVLPLPETLKLKGGALDKVLTSLKAKGVIDHLGTPRGDDPPPLRITRTGLEAIGVESEDDAREATMTPDTAPTSVEAENATGTSAPASEVDGANKRAKTKPAKGRGKKATTTARATGEPETAPAGEPTAKPTPRAGTKQAQMIEMLKRPAGATVEQIAAATGWQHHTIRGAISGALKKKLSLTVEATRTRDVGPNKTGAKGSTTVYRITGSGPETGTPPETN